VFKGHKCVVREKRDYVKMVLLLKISCPGTGVRCRSYIIPCIKMKRTTEVYKCLRRCDSFQPQAAVLRKK